MHRFCSAPLSSDLKPLYTQPLIRICSQSYNYLPARGDAGTNPSRQRDCAATASLSAETQGGASPPPIRTAPAPTRLFYYGLQIRITGSTASDPSLLTALYVYTLQDYWVIDKNQRLQLLVTFGDVLHAGRNELMGSSDRQADQPAHCCFILQCDSLPESRHIMLSHFHKKFDIDM